jgi:16S rRNA (guanine966-N2)-methyltransferase
LRVIAGSAKGRRLKGPGRGSKSPSVARPSSDLVRGALFSALASLDVDDSAVLDLYAGTGALGIEALSRGAGRCDFVEKDRAMVDIIRQNLELTAMADRASVHQGDVARVVDGLTGPYTLVLADPPYDEPTAWDTMEALATSGIIDPGGGTITVEHRTRDESREALGGFRRTRQLRHGESAVAIYRPAEDN